MDSIFIGGADAEGTGTPNVAQNLLLKIANRHGLIAGATGTGKTVTLQNLAQGFSDAGVPVFCADVKGDLSGICIPGSTDHKLHDKFVARANKIGLGEYEYTSAPTVFWDVFGEKGHPIRTTISEMGPLLLSRLMDLTDAQEGVLNIAFEYADDNGLLLLDLKDLRKLLVHMSDKEVRDELSKEYGNIASASLGAVQRNLLVMEREGADFFFGEPALELSDMMRTNTDGRGIVNVLDATRLINSPKLYSTFLLWLLSELFEQLPEIGDPDKPRLVFFFDEAHLLFDDAPAALMQKIEQVVRLIRSKGVGVYFVTQSPLDLPDAVLAQLGNRVQHALRAFTPRDQKAVRAAAQTFRTNPDLDTEAVITALGVGEALVSVLDEKGSPSIVQQIWVRPPDSQMGPITDAERAAMLAASPLKGVYDEPVDRESAYELLQQQAERSMSEEKPETRKQGTTRSRREKSMADEVTDMITSFGRSAMRSIGTQLGRQIVRGLLGSLRSR